METGVEFLTLYAFSSENWKRPPIEVNGLMLLLERFLNEKKEEMLREGVRLRAIGRLDDLPPPCRKKLDEVVAATAGNSRLHVILALSYSGRTEILDAVKSMVRDASAGTLAPTMSPPNSFPPASTPVESPTRTSSSAPPVK